MSEPHHYPKALRCPSRWNANFHCPCLSYERPMSKADEFFNSSITLCVVYVRCICKPETNVLTAQIRSPSATNKRFISGCCNWQKLVMQGCALGRIPRHMTMIFWGWIVVKPKTFCDCQISCKMPIRPPTQLFRCLENWFIDFTKRCLFMNVCQEIIK